MINAGVQRVADETNLVEMTIEVVASYVAHNNLRPDDVPGFIAQTHAAIAALTKTEVPDEVPTQEAAPQHEPAVTVRKSLASREHILSMINGKPYKTLKRHISRHGMTPAEYRERYGLKPDYPMTAPAYSEHRRDVAMTLGLGRKPKAQAPDAAPAPQEIAPVAKRRGRPPKAAAAPVEAASEAKRRGRPRKVAPEATAPSSDAPRELERVVDDGFYDSHAE